jgi:putative Ca2+/H+ antiporter (TMEM165/GDT1 family)
MDWRTVASAFGLLFVAELGDKTQLAVVTQVCRHRRPWAVFLGASLALVAATAIGAAGGQLMGRLIPRSILRFGAAVAFMVMGALVGWEAWGASREARVDPACEPSEQQAEGVPVTSRPGWQWQAFTSTLALLFVAELGDKTQLAVLSMAGQSGAPWAVFAGGSLALMCVTALGVLAGYGLGRLAPRRILLWVSAAVFVAMGLLMACGVL